MSIWEILNNKWSHLGKIKKIVEILEKIRYHNPMKLEKIHINRKHEMFWNFLTIFETFIIIKLTVNMKCFEMPLTKLLNQEYLINRKHEMFWNLQKMVEKEKLLKLTVNMKCFEILKALFLTLLMLY